MRFLLALLFCHSLPAQFITPTWRGDLNSEHAHWDVFIQRLNANSPDLAQDHPTHDAQLFNNESSAFITGTSNIYSFSAPIRLQINDSTNFAVRNVLLQISILGSDLDLDSLILIPPGATTLEEAISPQQFSLVSEEDIELGALPGGAPPNSLRRTYAFQFDLTATPVIGAYNITFRAAEDSMSLDQVVLDTSDLFLDVFDQSEELPAIEISQTGSQITLSWPAESSAVLESSTHLSDSESWAEVTTSPTQNNGQNELIFPANESPTFYRLRLPN